MPGIATPVHYLGLAGTAIVIVAAGYGITGWLSPAASADALRLVRENTAGQQGYASICDLQNGDRTMLSTSDSGHGERIQVTYPAVENVAVDEGTGPKIWMREPDVTNTDAIYSNVTCTASRATAQLTFNWQGKPQRVTIAANRKSALFGTTSVTPGS